MLYEDRTVLVPEHAIEWTVDSGLPVQEAYQEFLSEEETFGSYTALSGQYLDHSITAQTDLELNFTGSDIILPTMDDDSENVSSEDESDDCSTCSSDHDQLSQDDDGFADADCDSSITLGSDTTDYQSDMDSESEFEDASDASGSDLESESGDDSQTSNTSDDATDELMEELEPYPSHTQRAVRFEGTDKQIEPSGNKANYHRNRPLTPHATYHPYERKTGGKSSPNRTFVTADGRSSCLGIRDFSQENFMSDVAFDYLERTHISPVSGVVRKGINAGDETF